MAESLVAPLLLAIAALAYSAVGHGGASGYLAVMALLGTAPATMRPTALVLNLVVASIGTVQFARAGHFRWNLLWPFAVTSIPAAYLGGRLTLADTSYRAVVGVVLVISALRFLWTLKGPDGKTTTPSRPIALGAGALLGFLAGLTGVGGGIFLSPLLLFMGWADLRVTAATSAAFILVNSAAGLLGQLPISGLLPAALPLWIAAVIVGGGLGASMGSRRLPVPALRAVLALVLLVAGVKLIAG